MGMKRMPKIYEGITRITNLETEVDGTVHSALSAQFTVDYDDDTFGFLLHRLYGVDWKLEERTS